MVDYTGNTNKDKDIIKEKPPEKKIEKVVTGEVIKKQKPIAVRFKSIFFGGDIRVAGTYVVSDVILPAVRNLLYEITTQGVGRFIYGDRMNYRRPPDFYPRTTYNNPIHRDPRDPPYPPTAYQYPSYPSTVMTPGHTRIQEPYTGHPSRQVRHQTPNYILQTRAEADDVVERLLALIDQFDVVSFADLLSMLGYDSTPIDHKWGWTYLPKLEIRQVRNGFMIDLPPMETI